jgi:hypothetical protein
MLKHPEELTLHEWGEEGNEPIYYNSDGQAVTLSALCVGLIEIHDALVAVRKQLEAIDEKHFIEDWLLLSAELPLHYALTIHGEIDPVTDLRKREIRYVRDEGNHSIEFLEDVFRAGKDGEASNGQTGKHS